MIKLSKAQQKCSINTEREKGWFASRCLIGFAFDMAGLRLLVDQTQSFHQPCIHYFDITCPFTYVGLHP